MVYRLYFCACYWLKASIESDNSINGNIDDFRSIVSTKYKQAINFALL